MRRPILLLLAVATLTLGACASIAPAPAGAYANGKSEVILGRLWSDISATQPGRPKQVRLLSIDGPLLNRLYIADGIPVGGYLVRAPSKEEPTPLVRANMSANERMEFICESVAAMQYQRVEIARPRSAKLGDADAVRFDLTAKTQQGLDIRGTALVADVDGKLYFVLYLAPAEHYFDATLPEVEAIMKSAKVRS